MINKLIFGNLGFELVEVNPLSFKQRIYDSQNKYSEIATYEGHGSYIMDTIKIKDKRYGFKLIENGTTEETT